MPLPDLTPAQAKVLDQKVKLVEAGPGSGKTRSLVERFLQTSRSTRRGVALLSFTNAAINEVRRRTANSPRVLASPNFVGTIDAFLHRFIVTPAEVPRLGRMPSYRPSWADLPDYLAVLRLQAVPGFGVPLMAFRKTASGDVVINTNQLKQRQRQYLLEIDAAGCRQQLTNWARNIINGLNSAGFYDAHTARVRAFEILESACGPAVVQRLCRRFEEILLDEAQDCNEAEFRVIAALGQHTRTVLVADPDQAIFEFRGSAPKLFTGYRDSLSDDEKTSLHENHRSTPSICAATSSVRMGGQGPIIAVAQDKAPPVHVLGGTPTQQRQKFLAVLEVYDIPLRDAIVLSHTKARARSVAGVDDPAGDSLARGNRLAAASYVLRQSGASSSIRLRAITDVEDILLSLVEWPADVAKAGRDGKLAHAQRDAQWLRRSAGSLVAQLMPITDRAAFAATARAHIGQLLSQLDVDHLALGSTVQQADANRWAKCMAPAADGALLRYSTVHGAKGTEEAAVLLTLPAPLVADDAGRTVLDDWADHTPSERLRVLYVGASRARRLLCFGLANAVSGQLVTVLEAADVPVQLR